MKDIIVIPTYWTLPEKNTTGIFDHPTEYGENGTLKRLLKSMRGCKIKNEILILAAPICKKIDKKIKYIVSKFPTLDITIFQEHHLKKILSILKRNRFQKQFIKEVNVDDYGSLRNIALIMCTLRGADNIIQLDDDEVIEDRDYIKKAVEFIGKKVKGKKLVGKTGYYIDEKGRFKPKTKVPSWKKHWVKQKHLNKIYNSIKSKKRFHETSNALGGNIVINKELFCNVPYDPYIARGEDLDYLLNAKHFGFNFLFDNRLIVKHVPPKKDTPYWLKMRKDIYRFVYEREKLKYFNFKLEDLDSYPKFFLKEDLVYRAVITSTAYAKRCLKKGDKIGFNEGLKNAAIALKDAKQYAKANAPKYFKFQKQWVKLSRIIQKKF